MPKGTSTKPRRKHEDEAQAAVHVMQTIAAKHGEPEVKITDEMRAAAAGFAGIGGKIGGRKRAEKLSAKNMACYNMDGGITAWKAANLPTVQP